jgi:prevent-host-death family protein
MLDYVKTVAVTDLRQRAAEILEELRAGDEPFCILQRSQKVAYLVAAEHYERERAELAAARRALFLREVREAEAEYTAGTASVYEDVETLIADLDRPGP